MINVQRNYDIGWDELRFSSLRVKNPLHWYKLHVMVWLFSPPGAQLYVQVVKRSSACGVGACTNSLAWENIPTLIVSDQLFGEEHRFFPPFSVLGPQRSSHLKGCYSALPSKAGGLLSSSFRFDNSTCHLALHVDFYTVQHAFQQTPKY